MTQLEKLKLLLPDVNLSDDVLNLYLEMAKDIICNVRHTDYVEYEYLNIQLKIAIEQINRIGNEGQTAHSENGVDRTFDSGDVSHDLMGKIIPFVKTPFSSVRTES